MPDLAELPDPDEESASHVHSRARAVLRPLGALARLDEVAAWLASWQRTPRPRVEQPACVVFLADHGVAARGVSAYPVMVTGAMLGALERGVATASVLAREAGATLEVVDVGVGRPTADLVEEAALDEERFSACWDAGADAVRRQAADLLVVGEMGIGNTTAAAAVAAALFGGGAERWVGRGTGIDDDGLARKCTAVASAVARVRDLAPLEVLRHVGGSELVAMAAAIAEARRRSIPVLLDGYVVSAAAAALECERAGALDHCLAGHCSGEHGHRRLLRRLRKQPLLDLDLRLGEGSGALLAVPLVRMAAAAVVDVATFEESGFAP